MADESKSGPLYVGFDLGTTNSAAAVFDGDRVRAVQSRHGGVLTPSVVRITRRGTVVVGAKARRFLESDPANTRAEFKRLMGTNTAFDFEAAEVSRTPAELSAEVLRALVSDVAQETGVTPAAAIVTVPALFEVPQAAATEGAARLAGLDRVQLLQEPVASALAAGWSDDSEGRWLVYDLGGGTFDCTLLEPSGDGLLRVVGHEGDNFLGGRDIDAAIVDWMIQRLSADDGVTLRRDDPAHQSAFRQLALAAEEAKIELSRQSAAAVSLPEPVEIDGREIDIELVLDRATLQELLHPLIDRSVEICRRLMSEQGTESVQRVVLVGGPTASPILRARVEERLGSIQGGTDPMTLVAQGAALYAANAGLDARPKGARGTDDSSGVPRDGGRSEGAPVQLWLQHPSVSADPRPHVVGRRVGEAELRAVRFARTDGAEIVEASLDSEGAFLTELPLKPRSVSHFRVSGVGPGGAEVPVEPPELSIVHGVSIGAPPLSRSIGVALATGTVSEYFARGTPLPVRKTFSHKTVDALGPDSAAEALRIPIVQGEHEQAHLCREIGAIVIAAGDLSGAVPAGASVELTLSLDLGGRLAARALVPTTGQVFEDVAHLLVPDADVDALERVSDELRHRLSTARRRAFGSGDAGLAASLSRAEQAMSRAHAAIGAARGGDLDAGQRAHRDLQAVEETLYDEESQSQWAELDEDAQDLVASAVNLVSSFGTESERRLLEEAIEGVGRARTRRAPSELKRRLRRVRQLQWAALQRMPGFWEDELEFLSSRVAEMKDPARAQSLVHEGKVASGRSDAEALRRSVRSLWDLLPTNREAMHRAHDSGVR